MKYATFLLTIINSIALLLIIKQNKSIMSKQDQINASLQELDTATNEIAAMLEALKAEVGDNVSKESLTALDAGIARLKAMGKNPADPIPAPEA